MTYINIQPPFLTRHEEMSKKELQEYFAWFQNVLPERIVELTNTVQETPNFEHWQPDLMPESLDLLGDWFATQVEMSPRTEKDKEVKNGSKFHIEIPNEDLTVRTLSLAMDIGMYVSQVFLKNHPTLRWDQPLSNKKYVHYGHPVLAGFKAGAHEDHYNPFLMLKGLAYGIARKTKDGTRLHEAYSIWERKISL